MTKDEALDLALEALEYIYEGANNQGPHTGISWRCVAVKAEPAITAIKQARALDKKAENARELGLDYEPEERYTYGTPLLDAFTKPAPVQEPVGEVNRYGLDSHGRKWHGIYWYDANVDVPHGTKLYTTPPAAQRPWVGLTEEEISACDPQEEFWGLHEVVRRAEAKLKEKNT